MTDAALPAAAPPGDAVPAVRPEDGRLPFGERLSDRLNPILVRETQQALAGRAFGIALTLALIGVVIVGLTASADGGGTRERGWSSFVLSLQVLAPLLFLVLPMQAFLSMRQEVTVGTIEHLLLSRLTPGAVVRGKLAAAVVEAAVFFSLFAPLVSLAFLLRGVDVPTIALALGLCFVYAVAAAAFAIAMGALSRATAFRGLPLVAMALVLTVGTLMITSAMPFILRGLVQHSRFAPAGFPPFLVWSFPAVLAAPALYLAAAASLAHPYENRSTAFRVYALVALVVVVLWVGWATASVGMGSTRSVVPGVVAVCALLSAPFWFVAVTEEPRLSPRVRTLVPRRAPLALLSAAFLPGGTRGFLFTVLLAGVGLLLALRGSAWLEGVEPDDDEMRVALVAWAYVLVYASFGRTARALAPPGPRWTQVVRVAVPVLVVLLSLVPLLLEVLEGRRAPRSAGTSVFELLSPPAMLDAAERGHGDPYRALLFVVAALAAAVHVPGMVSGVREVLAASRERRRRAA